MDNVYFKPSEEFKDEADRIFEEQKKKLSSVFSYVEIHHTGSTVIPGSITKGDLDINIRVPQEKFNDALDTLKQIYTVDPNNENSDTIAFFKLDNQELPVGIQLTAIGSEYDNFLQHKQALLASPKLREEYNQLKQSFQGKTMDEYRKAKSEFFEVKVNHAGGYIILVKPSDQYKESFIEAVKEYQAHQDEDRQDIYELNVEKLENNFSSYVKKLQKESEGKNLPEGWVPQTTYWLIDNNEVIGRVAIRHSLTEHLLKEGGHIGYDIRPSKRNMGYGKEILELALPKAKDLGINKVLLTCNETNIGSKKIIEANGGVLENRLELGEGKPAKLRYWISL